jgi:uncharacterized protein (DUF2235 family)
VVFADGTGNAFRQQESNVWRLYDSLKKGGCSDGAVQIARYIPGVGTSAVGVIRMIDGATGFGVPANVRKLYRFLSWNWQEGDQIFLFGFSRGAFTVRTLAGMTRFQGLMPAQVDGRRVTDAEMKRNVQRAWDRYRELTAPLWQDGLRMSPHIAAVRWLRDRAVDLKRHLFRQPTHAQVENALPGHRRAGMVNVRYMGVFDTVEAYGFPFEGMRAIFSWWLWPITFRNRVCSRIVENADQVLALDDERLTFHPLRFDQTPVIPKPGEGPDQTKVREVWFAGVHSDVGGGYPDDAVAMDPLLWIHRAAGQKGLEFGELSEKGFKDRRFSHALIHDSRKGLASSYRYQPRQKLSDPAHGGPPILHASVIEKMSIGADGYAPLLLPPDVRLCGAPESYGRAGPVPFRRDAETDAVVARLIWRRKWLNRALLACAGLVVAMPFLNRLDGHIPGGLWGRAKALAGGVKSLIGFDPWPLWAVYQGVWVWTALILAVAAGLWFWAGAVQSRIKDTAMKVWQPLLPQ